MGDEAGSGVPAPESSRPSSSEESERFVSLCALCATTAVLLAFFEEPPFLMTCTVVFKLGFFGSGFSDLGRLRSGSQV